MDHQPNDFEAPQFNLFEKDFKARAHGIYQKLREKNPLYPVTMPSGQRAWMVTRYEDVERMLKESRVVTKDSRQLFAEEELDRITPTVERENLLRSMLYADPPDHTRLRALIHQAFTPRMIERMQDRVQQVTEELIDQMRGQQEVDLIDRFAFPLPITVICDMLGIPVEDRPLFRQWSHLFMQFSNQPQKMVQYRPHTEAFLDYMGEQFAWRRRHPQDDLLTALVQAEEAGEKLSKQELYSTVFLLIVAGRETTVNLIANGMLALFEHPNQRIWLQEHLHEMKTAIEELLRYYSPVEIGTARWAAEKISLYGQTIQPGDMIIAVIASANRDERKFTAPDQLNLQRKPNPHLAFGNGIHYCLGAPLARMEAKIAFTNLLKHFPHMELAIKPESLSWDTTYLMRGLRSLPVAL